MDRQIVYPGSIPLDTDLLNMQRHVMTAIGTLARAVLGDGGLVDGMPCIPGDLPYTVVIGAGSFTTLLDSDYSAFGSLPANPTPLSQTALQQSAARLQLAPPPGPDQVLCWLVQICITVQDSQPVALPYWNAANPAVPFSGPGNSGAAQPTQRQVRVQLGCKPGVPQAAPALPPTPDAGWVGLYAVTTYPGKPQIEIDDIFELSTAPTLRFTLPSIVSAPSSQVVLSGTAVWRTPPRVRQIRVRLVAGGGGGGGGTDYSGGGGGAGGYAEAFVAVQPGRPYDVVVGAGGAPGLSGETGGSGGVTSFAGMVQASGGLGGGAQNPDSHGGGPGGGVIGSLLQLGGMGGDGAAAAIVPGGNGGASAFGGGGRGADEGGAPAYGTASGSGGGGGYGALSPGGGGAGGIVIIEY